MDVHSPAMRIDSWDVCFLADRSKSIITAGLKGSLGEPGEYCVGISTRTNDMQIDRC